MPDEKDMFDFGDTPPEEEDKELSPSAFVSNIMGARNLSTFNPCDLHGSLNIIKFRVEASEDYITGSSFSLCLIPPSEVRLLGHLCRIEYRLSCGEAALGWSKYKTRGRLTVPTERDGFGIIQKPNGILTFLGPEEEDLQTMKVDSLEGIGLVCTALGDGKEGDFIDGYLVYVKL